MGAKRLGGETSWRRNIQWGETTKGKRSAVGGGGGCLGGEEMVFGANDSDSKLECFGESLSVLGVIRRTNGDYANSP